MAIYNRGTPKQEEQQEKSPSNMPYFSRPISWQHTFYLSGAIENASNYAEWFEIIRTAGPDDIVCMNINSMGGSYHTALQFRRVMMESMATISCSIEGECHSAASIIYLSGDQFSVSEGSSMLIHDYSSIVGGKGSEMIRQIQHEKISIDTFLKDVYDKFLTDQEIQNVVSGQDMWLDDDLIIERTQKMVEERDKMNVSPEENLEEDPEPEQEVLKKKPRSRKK